jgi:hypothetical protein
MKKLFVILACAVAAVTSYAQGTVNFTTRIPGVVDVVFTNPGGAKLDGTGYTAQLYGGAAGAAEGALVALTPTTTFRSGAGAGYITPAGAVVVTGVPGGQTASIQIRVWNNQGGTITSYEQARASATGEFGQSEVFQISSLGDPNASPPGVPVDPVGFGTGKTYATQIVPEPTTIALGLLGAAALFLRRRK